MTFASVSVILDILKPIWRDRESWRKNNAILSKRDLKQGSSLTHGIEIRLEFSGLYYKRVTIVIDPPSVIKVTLQIVASLTIVIDDARLRLS